MWDGLKTAVAIFLEHVNAYEVRENFFITEDYLPNEFSDDGFFSYQTGIGFEILNVDII